MPLHVVHLDFNKSSRRTREEVVIRIGDHGSQTLRVYLTDDGIPYQPEGSLRIQIQRKDGGLVRSKPLAHVRNNIYEGVIPSPAYAAHGVALLAYVAEYKTGTICATTSEFKLRVLPGTTDEEAVRFYDEELEQLINAVGATGSEVEANEAARQRAENARVQAENERDTAEKARAEAESARDTAEQARDAAEQKRDSAETARAEAESGRVEAENSRVEVEASRVQAETERSEAESARDAAETLREQSEDAREQAETERAAAEETRKQQEASRVDAEASRVGAETEREAAEELRDEAETARDAAETLRAQAEEARADAETARDTAEDERAEAESQRQANEITRRASEQTREAAETLRSDAETARDEAERKRVQAEDERSAAEESRVEVEASRVEAETARETAETARDEAETERDTAEKERKHYEDQRRAAEIQRQRAEVQRNANETTRKRQEDERVAADAERTTQQAKNNADQAANNLAAQGQQRVFLVEDQYDPVTRVPTLEGEFGIIYCVPRQDPEEIDQYIEWIVTYGAEGSKRWERVGTSDVVLPDAITTEQIDQIVDEDASLQGPEILNAVGLSYLWQKVKAWVTNAIKNAPAKQPDPRALRAKLAEANAAKEAAVVAGVGSDYDFGTIVTQQADYDTFCAAIDAAQSIYDEHYSQEELDDATATLDEALRAFKAASHEVVADRSKWTPLVESHATYKQDVHESEDGSDVRDGEQWSTPANWSAYDSAYAKASGEVESATKQSQIDSAVSDLTQAEETFGETIQTAHTSTDALQAAISAANAAMDGIKTSDDGADVYDFERWATEGDFTALRAAIASATETLSSGCSQDELDEATATLKAATSTFEGAIQDGLRHIQYGTLDGLISAAQDLLDETVTSESDGEDVSVHVQWTTPEDRATFEAAKRSAEAVRSSARTQEAVDEAASTLQTATEAFEAARKPGLMPIDLQELDKQLAAARQALSDSQESEDGSDVPNGKQWSTAEHRQTLQTAITEAERIRSESTQQDEVDAEAKTLEAAVTAYNATLQTAETSTTALSEAIEAATQAKAGIVESADGTDVYESGRWVTHEVMEALDQAIETAQGVLTSGCSQDDLDAATQAITGATSTFTAAIKQGTKIDYIKLDAALSAANAAKADVQASADGKDVPFGSKWVESADLSTFSEAIETAQGVRAGAANQAAADAAATTLEAATSAFSPKVKTATADTSALDAAITAANAAKEDVQTSDQNGEDLEAGSSYVTTEQMATFNSAIQAATTAKTASTTQNQLDAATSTLTSATDTFKGQIKQNVTIYGVDFSGFPASTKGTRTDAAADFGDPSPAVGTGAGSSPFDSCFPWSEIKRVTRSGNEMVQIPKFYYKLEQSGVGVKIQIASGKVEGFEVSPAHMDRSDGHGEREYVYVGRYHTSTGYKSVSKVNPLANITRNDARTGSKGTANFYQLDYATRFTIQLLYLVEFADFNSQAKIGGGCSTSGSVMQMGYTDTMTYHTGTTAASIGAAVYGGTQYRYIEGLWDNVYDWLDGCRYDSQGLHVIVNPAEFSDTSGGKLVGLPVAGYPSKLGVSKTGGFTAFYPTEGSGTDSTGTCDYWYFSASSPCLFVGGNYSQNQYRGLFFVNYNSAAYKSASRGSRLLELP